VNSTNSTPPYASWSTASTDIQSAIVASSNGDLVLVTNGVYQTGGETVNGYTLTNRVVINKAVTVQSVNGPAVTTIQGYQVPGTTNGVGAVRCVYMTNNATLIGFTLNSGATLLSFSDYGHEASGGGIWCEDTSSVISNCLLLANAANFSSGGGGGIVSGTLYNCTLIGNSAGAGGGAYNSILNNCLLLTNRAAASSGGGAYGGTLNNCILTGNYGGGGGGGGNCILNNCIVTNNSAGNGGGILSATATGCTISGNSASGNGGGAYISTLTNCTLAFNTAANYGGGAYKGTLYSCIISSNSTAFNSANGLLGGGTYSATVVKCYLTGNIAGSGGGADLGTLNNCVISGNTSLHAGGGVNAATVYNCALIENTALNNGGGAAASTLNNCTLTGNIANSGGGADSSTLTNCIVYYNNALVGTNFQGSSFNYCCTAPLPTNGFANITNGPALTDNFHISASSPCIGAGNLTSVQGTDMDGELWANPPSIGCDEYHAVITTGQLSVGIQSAFTNLAIGFADNLTAQINGHATMSYWNFGDGILLTNQPYASHVWTTPGSYQVSYWAFNDSNPAGASATITVQVSNQPEQYVALSNANPVAPYVSWATAATNIQDAVDTAFGGGLILVSNGVYQTGGRVLYGSLTNRVVINKSITVQSVNGPAVTTIQGFQVPGTINGDSAVRCVYLQNNAALIGFTVTNGATRDQVSGDSILERSGGGIFCASTSSLISNCIVAGNACSWYAAGVYAGTLNGGQILENTNRNGSLGGGGGAAFSVLLNSTISSNYNNTAGGALSCNLSNCVINGNSAGGVYNCVLNYCTLQGNTSINAMIGGGASQSTLTNCLLDYNRASTGGGAYDCMLNSCVVSNNTASSYGGGIYSDTYATNPPGQNTIVIGNVGSYGGGFYMTAGLSGLTNWSLANWNFTSNTATNDGGGLYLTSGRSVLNNCTFKGNSSGGSGGGCGGVPPNITIISNCTFIENIASSSGGGAYYGSVNNCFFSGNQAGNNGGGVMGIANDCVFNNNFAKTNGGGIYSYTAGGGGPIILNDCSFTNNSAKNGGGAFNGGGGPPTIFSNCIFSANSAVADGGAVNGEALKNCVVISNQAAFGGGGYGATMQNCAILYNKAGSGGGGYGGGFTTCNIIGNSATNSGGGIYFGIASPPIYAANCVIGNNLAALNGGGAFGGSMSQCTVTNNSAGANGGGSYNASIINCLVAGNAAASGGGLYAANLNNSTIVGNSSTSSGGGVYFSSGGSSTSCIIYDNSAPNGANYSGNATFNTCCTTPAPPVGSGNITNDPVFVNLSGGNYRLQTNSQCINTGSGNPSSTDLDFRPRVVGGRIDIGAYEFQGPGIGEFIAWLQQYGLPTSGLADYLDSDGDGMNNWLEWIAGTNPTNAASVLKLQSPATTNSIGITITWQSVSGVTYYLQSSTNLPAFTSIQSNIVGQASTTSITDTTATNGGPYFYRVGVQ
jgi:parallel beta-helix repeat protein/predicted outer membrane repeat protein